MDMGDMVSVDVTFRWVLGILSPRPGRHVYDVLFLAQLLYDFGDVLRLRRALPASDQLHNLKKQQFAY